MKKVKAIPRIFIVSLVYPSDRIEVFKETFLAGWNYEEREIDLKTVELIYKKLKTTQMFMHPDFAFYRNFPIVPKCKFVFSTIFENNNRRSKNVTTSKIIEIELISKH